MGPARSRADGSCSNVGPERSRADRTCVFQISGPG